jgi:predicted MFS family arabinose efflux permease
VAALRTDGAARPRHRPSDAAPYAAGAMIRPGRRGPWTPQTVAQLAVLAGAALIYVTAEILPVGALPAISRDLHVSVLAVGTLLASYALVAAVTTVPLVRWTAYWPRRRTLLLALMCLTVAQAISAMAPDFLVLAGGRVLCALTHGLLLSVLAPIATRLVPASYSGRATTSVYVGIGLAVVVGSPLTAAMSQLWGWRMAVAAVTAGGAFITVAAWVALPAMVLSGEQLATVGRGARHHRNRQLLTVSLLTLVAVVGQYISYTYIALIIRDVVGVRGPNLAWLLAAYGVAGLGAMPLVARPLDHRPRTAVISCAAFLWVTFLLLSALAFGNGRTLATALIGTAAIALWGGAANGAAPILQAAAMRAGGDDPDGASGLYVAVFQVGIMVGSLAGGLLCEHSERAMLAASAVLMGVALAGVTMARHMFDVPAVANSR